MDLGLKGAKVILTGGARGIGRAALDLFAAEGADIAFFARGAEKVAEAAAELAKHGGCVHAEAFDLSAGLDAYADWVKRAADTLGGCDVFVPGASSSGSQLTGDWAKSFEMDLMTVVRGCETLEAPLAASGKGSVVILSSTAAVETFIVPQAYNAMKAAQLTYAKQLGQVWGPKGIRVNTISPGPITFPGGNWEAIKQAMPDLHAQTEKGFALGRFGTPEEVAPAILFLASPAARYITGTNLIVDGGYTKRVQF